MLEIESYPLWVSPFCKESGDEEMSVLPRHTKVIVTGNNRTKSVLVGLQGVGKKAVGLGGWHWLVLKNGVEVKFQRNALRVLEAPTGNEEDYEFDDSSSGSEAGEKEHHRISFGFHVSKISKPRARYSRPWFPSASTKLLNHSSCREVQSKCQKKSIGEHNWLSKSFTMTPCFSISVFVIILIKSHQSSSVIYVFHVYPL